MHARRARTPCTCAPPPCYNDGASAWLLPATSATLPRASYRVDFLQPCMNDAYYWKSICSLDLYNICQVSGRPREPGAREIPTIIMTMLQCGARPTLPGLAGNNAAAAVQPVSASRHLGPHPQPLPQTLIQSTHTRSYRKVNPGIVRNPLIE